MDEAIDQYGANIGIAGEAGIEYAINLSYVNNIAESGGIQDSIGAMDLAGIVAGYALSGSLASGSFTVIGEYVSATDSFDITNIAFDGKGATPTAWNIEAAYNFALSDKAATLAVGLQGTGEAVTIELPESRSLVALSVEILPQTSITVEWRHDEDYGASDGGTGDSSDFYTMQLSAVF